LRRAKALIDRALAAEGPGGQWRTHLLAAKALADYREGLYEAAIVKAEGEAAAVLGPLPSLVAAMAHWRLARPGEARQALARAAVLFDWAPAQATTTDAWMYHALRQEAEAMILQDLTAFLEGTYRPTDNIERLCLLAVCQSRDLHLAAARLYGDAFDEAPELAADLTAGHRFRAARVAAATGWGLGADAASLGEAERPQWRKQAQHWLRADLSLCQKRLEAASSADRIGVAARLESWRSDPLVAGLREPAETAKLGPDERTDWDALWADIAAVLRAARIAQ
jgi:serine/threonine-protein kinase